jgi:hypothetical protein
VPGIADENLQASELRISDVDVATGNGKYYKGPGAGTGRYLNVSSGQHNASDGIESALILIKNSSNRSAALKDVG